MTAETDHQFTPQTRVCTELELDWVVTDGVILPKCAILLLSPE